MYLFLEWHLMGGEDKAARGQRLTTLAITNGKQRSPTVSVVHKTLSTAARCSNHFLLPALYSGLR